MYRILLGVPRGVVRSDSRSSRFSRDFLGEETFEVSAGSREVASRRAVSHDFSRLARETQTPVTSLRCFREASSGDACPNRESRAAAFSAIYFIIKFLVPHSVRDTGGTRVLVVGPNGV